MKSQSFKISVVIGLIVLVVASLGWWSLQGRPGGQARLPPPGKPAPFEIPYDPPVHVDPDEFEKRYAPYFEAEFQARQAKRADKDLDVDTLQSMMIRTKDGTLGTLFFDNKGKVVLAAKYPLVSQFSEGLAGVGTKADGPSDITNYGFIDRTGQLAIAANFELATDFHEGLAAAQKEKKWGYINRRGEFVIPARYRSAGEFRDGVAQVAPADNDDTVEYIDAKGHVLLTAQREASRFSEGLLYASLPIAPGSNSPIRRGYFNRDFKLVIPFEPDGKALWPTRCEEFHEGLAAVEFGTHRWGFINRDGELAIPGPYTRVGNFSQGLAMVNIGPGEIGMKGYIDRSGKIVIEPQFLGAGPFNEGLAPVLIPLPAEKGAPADKTTPSRPRGKMGYIDRTGKVVIPPRFFRTSAFKNGVARVSENPYHHGCIDKTGAYLWQITEPDWDR
jgi:hypothetical protein